MKKRSAMTAISILMLSLLPMSTGATASTIPSLMHQFSGVSAETAELTVTIPSFTMAVFIVISSFMIKKKLVQNGLFLQEQQLPHLVQYYRCLHQMF
nr:hypothetical protein [Lentilactobacillus otakiensis]